MPPYPDTLFKLLSSPVFASVPKYREATNTDSLIFFQPLIDQKNFSTWDKDTNYYTTEVVPGFKKIPSFLNTEIHGFAIFLK